jgi:hypothetical protein
MALVFAVSVFGSRIQHAVRIRHIAPSRVGRLNRRTNLPRALGSVEAFRFLPPPFAFNRQQVIVDFDLDVLHIRKIGLDDVFLLCF